MRLQSWYARRARNGELTMADYAGGCMTITNSGALGGEIFTPLINYPESAILGVGKIAKKGHCGRSRSGKTFIVCPMMYLCLTYDHRLISSSARPWVFWGR